VNTTDEQHLSVVAEYFTEQAQLMIKMNINAGYGLVPLIKVIIISYNLQFYFEVFLDSYS
jgi:hypothetical protein